MLFTNAREGGLEEFQIEVYSLGTGERHLLFKGGTYARYVPTGHIVYARKETLYAVRFDIERLKVVGSGVPVVPDVITSDLWWSGSAQFAIASDGTLAYVPVQARSAELRPVWVDRQGHVEALPGAPTVNYETVAVSPDGSQVAFNIMDGNKRDVWIYNLTRHTLIPLTSNGDSLYPIWSPDGKELFYRCGDKMIAMTIETEPEFRVTGYKELFKGRYLTFGAVHNYDVAPDGRFLVIQESQEPTPPCIHVVLNWFEELKRLVPPGK